MGASERSDSFIAKHTSCVRIKQKLRLLNGAEIDLHITSLSSMVCNELFAWQSRVISLTCIPVMYKERRAGKYLLVIQRGVFLIDSERTSLLSTEQHSSLRESTFSNIALKAMWSELESSLSVNGSEFGNLTKWNSHVSGTKSKWGMDEKRLSIFTE